MVDYLVSDRINSKSYPNLPTPFVQFTAFPKGGSERLRYDLARELGYCSTQEIREGEQWICLSGAWERWESAVKRGYSLDYLKKIMKKSKGG